MNFDVQKRKAGERIELSPSKNGDRNWLIITSVSIKGTVHYKSQNALKFLFFSSAANSDKYFGFSAVSISFVNGGGLKIHGLPDGKLFSSFVSREHGRFPCKTFQELFDLFLMNGGTAP